jgi:hypothetical protein
MQTVPQCLDCVHLRPRIWSCAAFPGRSTIPEAILTGRHDHRDAYPGDHGVRFEPIDGRDTRKGE